MEDDERGTIREYLDAIKTSIEAAEAQLTIAKNSLNNLDKRLVGDKI